MMRCLSRRSLPLALFSLLVLPAPSRADLIVVPNANAGVDGDNGFLRPMDSFAITLQTAIAASELTAVVPGSRITGLAYRLDESGVELMWPAGDRTFAQYNIQLSTSNFAPLSLSIVYADNIGPDVVTVRSGPLTLPDGSFTNSAGAPNAFGPIITFPTPYTYAGGDLLITIRHTGHGLFSDHMDGVTGNALISGMASFGFDSPFEDGLFLRGSPVYQLQFEPVTVPEPTTFTLLAVGVLGGYARLRRKRAA